MTTYDFPYVWTLVTSLLIESNPFIMALQLLFINRLLVYISGRNQDDLLVMTDSMWTFRQVLGMLTFIGVFSGLPWLLLRYLGSITYFGTPSLM